MFRINPRVTPPSFLFPDPMRPQEIPPQIETSSDGHPVGPQGVYGINHPYGTYSGAFNYAAASFLALNKVQVTFGSGASGLYGTDATGGTIDMQTLNPTRKRSVSLIQGVGDQGQQKTAFKATGTIGRLGYALAGGVQGLYGMFPGAQIAQTSRPNNFGINPCPAQPNPDLTSCNLAANTYRVTGDTTLRTGLVKFRYALSGNTDITAAWYAAGQEADSTGNGDGDNIPYDSRLGLIQANPGNCSLPTDPAGTTSGYLVSIDSNPNACYSAAQYAANSSGPAGGGPNRKRGTSFFDYHARLTTISKKSTYAADLFFDHYKFYKSSQVAGGFDPALGIYTGYVYSQFTNSTGLMLSDDIANDKTDLGFGYFVEHQVQTRLNYNDPNAPTLGTFDYSAPAALGYGSGFVRGSAFLTRQVSVFANAWLKKSSVTGQTNLDPRISFVVRPKSGHDVFRFTFGHTTGDPAPELKSSGLPVINGNPSSLNPNCFINTIGSGGNPAITSEKANDLEFGYAHSFTRDSSVQVNVYSTNVGNQLFAASEPLSQFPGVTLDPLSLAQYASKINSVGCQIGGQPVTAANVTALLGISTTYNAANAQYRGIELSGRQRFNRNVYLDYSYDIQSGVQSGIPNSILANNPTIINGAQIAYLPTHKASLGIDYSKNGYEGRLDAFFVGPNNPSMRPGYNYFNGFVGKTLPNGLAVRLGVQNVFNQNVQNYGYFGHQLFVPENQFFHDSNSLQQFVNTGTGELFGLPSRTLMLTFSQSI